MGQQSIAGSEKLAEAIRRRRQELGLTIEEAARKADVGTKTWCRYEAGGSVRRDKYKGVCKALSWQGPLEVVSDEDDVPDFQDYRCHEAWSPYIQKNFGEVAAISFVIGSDLLLDAIQEDLHALSSLPRGSHIGQTESSWLDFLLPPQFLMRYDYEFLYCLQATLLQLRSKAHSGREFWAQSVLEELVLYLIVEKSEELVRSMASKLTDAGIEYSDTWNDWIFDLFGDMDLITQLYSDFYLTGENTYHFAHWTEKNFYKNR